MHQDNEQKEFQRFSRLCLQSQTRGRRGVNGIRGLAWVIAMDCTPRSISECCSSNLSMALFGQPSYSLCGLSCDLCCSSGDTSGQPWHMVLSLQMDSIQELCNHGFFHLDSKEYCRQFGSQAEIRHRGGTEGEIPHQAHV